MTLRWVPAQLHHAHLIAQSMSAEACEEVRAQTGLVSMEQAINQAIRSSPRYGRVVFAGLVPLACFGLSHLTLLGESAQVWCFGTRHIPAHRFAFARASIRALREMHGVARTLTNYVAATDEPAVKWLEFLGAHFVLRPESRNGRLFAQFILASGEKTCQQG